MIHAHTVICGAGILGLTLARELLRRGDTDILILEKERASGAHASGRNSGVLHAGIYYAPGSARAATCRRGGALMREYCLENGLPLKDNGKVIVAANPEQLPALDNLYKRATANGATVRLIDEAELARIEPHARTVDRAIHSPCTAVVDPIAILKRLTDELTSSGKVRILYGVRVTGAGQPGTVATTDGPVGFGRLVNTLGSHADTLAHAFGVGKQYQLIPFKGAYKRLAPDAAVQVRGSIYPVPDPRNPFLGVHFTRGVSGAVYVGPTAAPAFGRENYSGIAGTGPETLRILYRDAILFCTNDAFRTVAVEETKKYAFSHFFREARRLVRGLRPRDIQSSPKVGIRPQLVHIPTGELVTDFLVETEGNTTHILNAISPAFTSSMAFAQTVADTAIPDV